MKNTIRFIKNAIKSGTVSSPFAAAQVNSAIGIGWAGNFLEKHCENTGSSTLFKRVSRGLYQIKE